MTTIAIPDSCLVDERTQIDKSRKISQFARACAIFGVDTIYVYKDGGSNSDLDLLVVILRYMETPPFLRKRLFPKISELKYAGILAPLNISSHSSPPNPKKISSGDIRSGLVVSQKGKKYIDIGTPEPFPYRGRTESGKRIAIKFKMGYPELNYVEVEESDYFGYKTRERNSLANIIKSWTGQIILTSRLGRAITTSDIHSYANSKDEILLAFGSTERGVGEILGSHAKRMQNTKTLNFFPKQNTKTVRLEEAVFGCLSILHSGA
ncbi:MAG: hypothetical protein K8823_1067 [Cenarchaeum symbiont of Oopsacas minuta]|nr:hypothetical protein [Cenarchaeum symbiont of Oopsacas minuta]